VVVLSECYVARRCPLDDSEWYVIVRPGSFARVLGLITSQQLVDVPKTMRRIDGARFRQNRVEVVPYIRCQP
jgi:hypothetical protein